MRYKNLIAILLLLCTIFSLSGCGKAEITPVLTGLEFVEEGSGGDAEIPEAKIAEREAYFTLWSNQFASQEDARAFLEEIKDCGYSGIEFCILWGDFAYANDENCDWAFIDSIVDVFVQNGYSLSLSLVLWADHIEWKDLLEFQQTSDGEIYAWDESPGMLSFNSVENLNHIQNSLQAFAIHFTEKYEQHIARWGVRTSRYGKQEYATTIDLDYSPSAMEAFYKHLVAKYDTIENFNDYHNTSYTGWTALQADDKQKVTSTARYEWKIFKQQTIAEFSKITTDTFKALNPVVPVVFYGSSFTDSICAEYRGIFDAYTIAKVSGADIIQADSDITNENYSFIFDMLLSTTEKAVSTEIDGGWQGDKAVEEYANIAESMGKTGINYISVANWIKNDIQKYYQTFSTYVSKYTLASEREKTESKEIILVNTLDFILRKPSANLYTLYKNAYINMNNKGSTQVIFLTDTQIIDNPELLNDVSVVHMGLLDNTVYLYEELAQLLANKDCEIVDNNNAQPVFRNQYDQQINEELQSKLNDKIANG